LAQAILAPVVGVGSSDAIIEKHASNA